MYRIVRKKGKTWYAVLVSEEWMKDEREVQDFNIYLNAGYSIVFMKELEYFQIAEDERIEVVQRENYISSIDKSI